MKRAAIIIALLLSTIPAAAIVDGFAWFWTGVAATSIQWTETRMMIAVGATVVSMWLAMGVSTGVFDKASES